MYTTTEHILKPWSHVPIDHVSSASSSPGLALFLVHLWSIGSLVRYRSYLWLVRLPPMVSNVETHCFFSSIFVSMVENIILRPLDGSLRRLVSKFKVQTSSQPNRWVYVSEIFILSFFFLFFLLSSTNPSNSLSLPFSFLRKLILTIKLIHTLGQ